MKGFWLGHSVGSGLAMLSHRGVPILNILFILSKDSPSVLHTSSYLGNHLLGVLAREKGTQQTSPKGAVKETTVED